MNQPITASTPSRKATVIRVLLQCWLAWPALMLLPVIFFMSMAHLGEPSRLHDLRVLALMLLLPCAIALIVSIFAPGPWFQHPLAGWIFLVLLPLGCVCTAVLFREAFHKQAPTRFLEYHLFLGPVAAALWNLARIVRIRWFPPRFRHEPLQTVAATLLAIIASFP